VGADNRKRHDDAGEIDLAEDVRIFLERVGRAGKAVVEEVPKHNAGKVKKNRWYGAGRNSNYFTKDKHISDQRHDRLEKDPDGAQYGLLVVQQKLAPHQATH